MRSKGSFGALSAASLAFPTEEDLVGLCNTDQEDWEVVEICSDWSNENMREVMTLGISTADLNNDGAIRLRC